MVMFELDKEMILMTMIEVLVNVVMASHVYKFRRKSYLQCDGGPIGLRSTVCLAALIMKIWDSAWMT